jgi:phosphoribosyl-dephospho-CoA transferase
MVRSNLPRAFAKPHDLLQLESPESIHDLESAPEWVYESLSACPYVVVRRQPPSENGIAIGVRGKTRDQRWPCFVSPDRVRSTVSPFELRAGTSIKPERLEAIPALRHLLALEEKWCNLDFKWGPGGSVGFELASAYPAATPLSDLDIVLFAPIPFDYEYASSLLLSVRQIAACIDVLVETPECAFSLAEFANSQNHPLLLRCLDGPRMEVNPWSLENAPRMAVDPWYMENAARGAADPWCVENASRPSDIKHAELETPV